MTQQTNQSKIETFVDQLRGRKGELGLLVRLAGQLQYHCGDSNREVSVSSTQRVAGVLKTRIAQLSRSSEADMREAATNVGRIGKALQEQKANEETVRQFGPVLVLLQKRIAHATRKVQTSKTAVQSLDTMLTALSKAGSSAEGRSKSAAAETSEPASRRKARKKSKN